MSNCSSSLEMRRRLIQTKGCYKFFYSIWKETSHKPLKVAAAKKSFQSVKTQTEHKQTENTKSAERQKKTSFPKEKVENTDLDKPVLNKVMTTRE